MRQLDVFAQNSYTRKDFPIQKYSSDKECFPDKIYLRGTKTQVSVMCTVLPQMSDSMLIQLWSDNKLEPALSCSRCSVDSLDQRQKLSEAVQNLFDASWPGKTVEKTQQHQSFLIPLLPSRAASYTRTAGPYSHRCQRYQRTKTYREYSSASLRIRAVVQFVIE